MDFDPNEKVSRLLLLAAHGSCQALAAVSVRRHQLPPTQKAPTLRSVGAFCVGILQGRYLIISTSALIMAL